MTTKKPPDGRPDKGARRLTIGDLAEAAGTSRKQVMDAVRSGHLTQRGGLFEADAAVMFKRWIARGGR